MKAITLFAAAGLFVAGSAFAADGKAVYQTACKNCHDAGVAGAPKLGDKAGWAARLKQGDAKLIEVALKGKPGTAMMAKGGFANLKDDEVKAAAEFMIKSAK